MKNCLQITENGQNQPSQKGTTSRTTTVLTSSRVVSVDKGHTARKFDVPEPDHANN